MVWTVTLYVEGDTDGSVVCKLLGRSPESSLNFMNVTDREGGKHYIDQDIYMIKAEDLELEVKLTYSLSILFPRIRYMLRKDLSPVEGPGPLLDSSLYSNYKTTDTWTIQSELRQTYQLYLNYYSMDVRCHLDIVHGMLRLTKYHDMAKEAAYLEQSIENFENGCDAYTNPLVPFYKWLFDRREKAKRYAINSAIPQLAEANRQALIVMTAVLKLCKEHLDTNEEQYNG